MAGTVIDPPKTAENESTPETVLETLVDGAPPVGGEVDETESNPNQKKFDDEQLALAADEGTSLSGVVNANKSKELQQKEEEEKNRSNRLLALNSIELQIQQWKNLQDAYEERDAAVAEAEKIKAEIGALGIDLSDAQIAADNAQADLVAAQTKAQSTSQDLANVITVNVTIDGAEQTRGIYDNASMPGHYFFLDKDEWGNDLYTEITDPEIIKQIEAQKASGKDFANGHYFKDVEHADNQRQTKHCEKRLADAQEKLDGIKAKVESAQTRLTAAEEKIAELDVKIKSLEENALKNLSPEEQERFRAMDPEQRKAFIQDTINDLEAQKAEYSSQALTAKSVIETGNTLSLTVQQGMVCGINDAANLSIATEYKQTKVLINDFFEETETFDQSYNDSQTRLAALTQEIQSTAIEMIELQNEMTALAIVRDVALNQQQTAQTSYNSVLEAQSNLTAEISRITDRQQDITGNIVSVGTQKTKLELQRAEILRLSEQIKTSIEGYDGKDRSGFLVKAYTGETGLSGHTKMMGLNAAGFEFPTVTTSDGKVVYKDSETNTLYTLDKDPATNAEIKTVLTDPLEIARAEAQAWNLPVPRLFGNESQTGNTSDNALSAGWKKVTGFLDFHVFSDPKSLSGQRVDTAVNATMDALEKIDQQLAELDAQKIAGELELASLKTELELKNADLAEAAIGLQDANLELEAIKSVVADYDIQITQYKQTLEIQQAMVDLQRNYGLITPANEAKLAAAAQALEDANAQHGAAVYDAKMLFQHQDAIDAEMITVSGVTIPGITDADYHGTSGKAYFEAVYANEKGEIYFQGADGIKVSIDALSPEDQQSVRDQIAEQQGQGFANQLPEHVSDLRALHSQIADRREAYAAANAAVAAAKEQLKEASGQTETVDDPAMKPDPAQTRADEITSEIAAALSREGSSSVSLSRIEDILEGYEITDPAVASAVAGNLQRTSDFTIVAPVSSAGVLDAGANLASMPVVSSDDAPALDADAASRVQFSLATNTPENTTGYTPQTEPAARVSMGT